ncbi:MUTS homolog 7 [Wolffia australiana]
MRRQQSILSFFQKPSPEDQIKTANSLAEDQINDSTAARRPESSQKRGSTVYSASMENKLPLDVRGTDTPPEKPPRPRFSDIGKCDVAARPFASILHKFVKRDLPETNPSDCDLVFSEDLEDRSPETFRQKCVTNVGINDNNRDVDNTCSNPLAKPTSEKEWNEISDSELLTFLDLEPADLEPETPEMRRFPHSKRVQVDVDSVRQSEHAPFVESIKRKKTIHELAPNKASSERASETAGSKFKWLDPAFIKDANGRRPNDPLHDKKTLYIPSGELAKMSASQKQYWNVKREYMDVVLFFKVGKFYELYELDAEIGQKELDWKMTNSGVGKCRQVGISESGIDDAVQKLLARGYKIGRIEQLETANQAKSRGATSVIQRKLVNVLTPSTLVDGSIGPDAVHLLALKEGKYEGENRKTGYGFAFVDCAASRFWVGSVEDDGTCASLGTLLLQVSPREVVYENRGLCVGSEKALRKYTSADSHPVQLTPTTFHTGLTNACDIHRFITSKGYFKGGSSLGDMTSLHDLALSALGLLMDHLSRLMLEDLLRNGDVLPYHVYRSCLRMDGQTLVNLEILRNNVDGGPSGTLYKFLDHCLTAPGRRLLRRWICHPLQDVDEVNDRLNVVDAFTSNAGLASLVSESLRKLPDLERLLGHVKSSAGSSSALLLPLVGERVLKARVRSLGHLVKGLRVGADLLALLLEEGRRIPSLVKILNCPLMQQFEEFIREIESAVDSSFPRFQDHSVEEGDAEAYGQLAETVCERVADLTRFIHGLSCADVLRSFAGAAAVSSGPMNRPVLLPAGSTGGPVLEVRGLWHPYAVCGNEDRLVPNDVVLGGSSGRAPRTLLLTGPNMGGKSTLLRATCLAAVLAQLGCYVPCDSCVLSTVDVIFTRLGAVDRIMSGESTFYVECAETATILQNSTQDSLVLLDELGRGTSTFDGYAIAYAVLRHLVERVDCRLLFATHYHPLTKEFGSHPRVSLQHMACLFRDDGDDKRKELVFLYKLAAGPCPASYGMQVALAAGVPPPVVAAAAVAAQRMQASTAASFRSSERRAAFSSLHEDALRTLLALSSAAASGDDVDASDTALCLWHELHTVYS